MRVVFFDFSESPEFFPKHFHGFKPLIPGIVKVVPEGKIAKGILRKVSLSDGSSVIERITEHVPNQLHSYEMAELNKLQKLVCQSMSATFKLEDLRDSVRVTWTYQIKSTNPFQTPLIMLVGWAFGKAMSRCLASMAKGSA
ncbi:MAG: SRPBCC family protein [Spirochaetia bacterium]|nr:SRPBCC family protein [Spirochaetia bacterium]